MWGHRRRRRRVRRASCMVTLTPNFVHVGAQFWWSVTVQARGQTSSAAVSGCWPPRACGGSMPTYWTLNFLLFGTSIPVSTTGLRWRGGRRLGGRGSAGQRDDVGLHRRAWCCDLGRSSNRAQHTDDAPGWHGDLPRPDPAYERDRLYVCVVVGWKSGPLVDPESRAGCRQAQKTFPGLIA